MGRKIPEYRLRSKRVLLTNLVRVAAGRKYFDRMHSG